MKQQNNHFPSKANSTTKDQNTCVEEALSNTEFQKTIVKMINDLKEETQKLVFDLKGNVNKQLNEHKENTNKQMNEIKQTIQDMKEEINKHMETLKNNQFKISNSISQINITIGSLANRVEQAENRVSGTEDRVARIVKDHEKMLRKYEWNMQDIWDTMKRPNLRIMGVEERRYKLKALTTIQ
jgi:methyl-accepting chemotaxis protein